MAAQHFGRYEIIRELGRGGMATVYVGRDTELGREVAVKVLPREFLHDREFLSRFKREARVAALDHKAIVPVYDIGEQDGQPYIVMKLMRGGALDDRLARGPLPLSEALAVLRRMASALDFAHRSGVVHRDVKPANVLFDDDGDAYISDFGIAKALGNTVTATRGIIGTPAYMSPEQFRPRVVPDGRADQYALAIVTYELLTGQVPFVANDMVEHMYEHINTAPPSVQTVAPTLPIELEAPLHRALAKQPNDRFPTCKDFVAALTAAANVQPGASAAGLPPRRAAAAPPLTPPSQPVPEQPALIFCETCGTSNPPSATICRNCGNNPRLSPVPAAPPVMPGKLPVPPPDTGAIDKARPTPPPAASPPSARTTTRNVLLIGGGGVALLTLAGVVIVLGLGGWWVMSNLLDADPIAMVAATATRTPRPSATPRPSNTPTITPSPSATPTPDPLELARTPVAANADWVPVATVFADDPAGATMVLVPAGCFMMGSEDGRSDESPEHQQCIDEPFWLDETEVTNAMYGAAGDFPAPDQPRDSVNWYEARDFCESRSMRLPTEVEWEFAAAGPSDWTYPWGNTYDGALAIGQDDPTYGDNSTAPVGSRPAGVSWVGALDMSGNLWEWVNSRKLAYPYDADDGREAGFEWLVGHVLAQPALQDDASEPFVLRGGSFISEPDWLRTAVRNSNQPDNELNKYGFRCARSP